MSKKLGNVIHLGIVVEDVYKAVEIYEKEFGISTWEISDSKGFFADKTVNGEKGLFIISAIHREDGYEIELIMPNGPGVFKDWLEEHGPGLHHVKLETEESYEDLAEMAKRISGRKPYLDVQWPDGRPLVAYLDMQKEKGLLLEVSGS